MLLPVTYTHNISELFNGYVNLDCGHDGLDQSHPIF